MAELASYVDEKIRSAAEATPTSDMVRVAVLAALNIADEFFRGRDVERDWQRQLADARRARRAAARCQAARSGPHADFVLPSPIPDLAFDPAAS